VFNIPENEMDPLCALKALDNHSNSVAPLPALLKCVHEIKLTWDT